MKRTINFVQGLLVRGQNLQQLGIDVKALPVFEALSHFRNLPNKTRSQTRSRLTRLYRKQKKYRRARRMLAKMAHRNPDSAKHHYKMARLVEKDITCDPKRARYHYLRALKLEPANPRFLSGYGVYAIHFGCRNRGLKALRKAYKLAPDNALVLKRYIKALQQLHLLREARRILHVSRFRLGKCGWFQKLCDEFQFTVLRLRQKKRRQTESADAALPTILPFVPPINPQPADEELEGFRIDGADVLPAPKISLRLPRPDQRHAQ